MTFEGQYLTYAEYQELGGSAIGEMPFNLLEFEARRNIDIRTQNRLQGATDIPNEVKLCEFSLINEIKRYAESENANTNMNVSSESTDGYSITYLTIDKIRDVVSSKNTEIQTTIETYLTGVVYNKEHIIYCGIK